MQNFEINLAREFILAGDISASMETRDCGGLSRYEYMLEKFRAFMQTTKDFDKHGGCTVMLFGQYVHKYEHADIETVEKRLSNIKFESATMTDVLIRDAFDEHLEEKAEMARNKQFHPGTVLMIFTDGEPSTAQGVIRQIESIVNRIDRKEEFEIVFLTVGDTGEAIERFLSDLCHRPMKHQIVRVEKLENISFIAAASGLKDV